MTTEQLAGQQRETNKFNAEREYKCPDYGGSTHYMGMDFKAPKKSDIKAWEQVRKYIESGNTYYRGLK